MFWAWEKHQEWRKAMREEGRKEGYAEGWKEGLEEVRQENRKAMLPPPGKGVQGDRNSLGTPAAAAAGGVVQDFADA